MNASTPQQLAKPPLNSPALDEKDNFNYVWQAWFDDIASNAVSSAGLQTALSNLAIPSKSTNLSALETLINTKSIGFVYQTAPNNFVEYPFSGTGIMLSVAHSDHNHLGIYQPLNAELTAISDFDSSTGFIYQTGANAFVKYDFGTAANTVAMGNHTHANMLTGSLTPGYVPVATGAQTVGNSGIFQNSYSFGLNTATPSFDFTGTGLEIYGGSSSIKFTSATTGGGAGNGFDIGQAAATGYVWNRENASINFGTNNSFAMIIDNLGRVGIGFNGPLSELCINGGVNIGSAAAITEGAQQRWSNFADAGIYLELTMAGSIAAFSHASLFSFEAGINIGSQQTLATNEKFRLSYDDSKYSSHIISSAGDYTQNIIGGLFVQPNQGINNVFQVRDTDTRTVKPVRIGNASVAPTNLLELALPTNELHIIDAVQESNASESYITVKIGTLQCYINVTATAP